jgi:hypothetical protein
VAVGLILTVTGIVIAGNDQASSAPTPPAPVDPAPARETAEAEALDTWWNEVAPDLDIFIRHTQQIGELDSEALAADPGKQLLRTLIADVDTLRGHGPAPLAEIDRPWQQALDGYGDGYRALLARLETVDAAQLTEGTGLVDQGKEHLNEALTAIAS